MKIFGLFGKPDVRHIRHPTAQASEEALATSRKIDTIESEISAEYEYAGELHEENPSSLTQCLDEAALLYANHKTDAARSLLLHAITLTDTAQENRLAWWMLFELALKENQPEFFDTLALDYAKAFGTSPPQWKIPDAHAATEAYKPSQALPVVNFRGKLCGSSQPALEQLQQLGLRHRQFCLQVGAISEIDLDGCQLFLRVLATWQSQSCHLQISDGQALTDALQRLILAGRRDSNDAGWQLAIEWMRLLNRQDDYEALCVDYCLTYEVSPPVAPEVHKSSAVHTPVFVMPHCIHLPLEPLLAQMENHARQSAALVLDCRSLVRVEFSAAVPWLNGLHRVAAGKTVECRDTSFLVSRLLHLVGGKSQLNIINRKP